MDPNDYDVLLTDITTNVQRSEFSEIAGVPYLGVPPEDEAEKVVRIGDAFNYGTKKPRLIFPCIGCFNGNARWVFFIVISGVPLTYLSAPVRAPSYGKKAWPLT